VIPVTRDVETEIHPFELAVIGGGNMGAALVGGLLASGAVDRARIVVVEVVEGRRTELGGLFPGSR
jgi:pyrroline-5-carboxylate reductase